MFYNIDWAEKSPLPEKTFLVVWKIGVWFRLECEFEAIFSLGFFVISAYLVEEVLLGPTNCSVKSRTFRGIGTHFPFGYLIFCCMFAMQ